MRGETAGPKDIVLDKYGVTLANANVGGDRWRRRHDEVLSVIKSELTAGRHAESITRRWVDKKCPGLFSRLVRMQRCNARLRGPQTQRFSPIPATHSEPKTVTPRAASLPNLELAVVPCPPFCASFGCAGVDR